MKINKLHIIYNLLLIIISFFVISCNEEPTNIGISFLQDTVLVVTISNSNDDAIFSTDSNYVIDRATNNTGAIMVGSANNIQSASFLRFDFPSGLGWITEDDIISSELLLFPLHYAMGDTSGTNTLSFDIKKIVKKWTFEDTKAQDVFNDNTLYDVNSLATWTGNIVYKDEASRDSLDTISINIPKSLCVDWFSKRNTPPTDSTPDSEITWGLALLPNAQSTVINSFKAAGNTYSTGSVMKIVYKKKLDNGNDTNITLYVNAGIETKFVKINETFNKDDLIIQSGVKVHTRLNFNIENIPNLASVNMAELTLTMDLDRSYWGNEGLDTVFRLGLFPDLDNEFKHIDPSLICYGRRIEGTNQYVFRSAEIMLMYLLRSQAGSGNLVLMNGSNEQEANTLNRYAFFGSNASNEEARPKLKLVYSYLQGND